MEINEADLEKSENTCIGRNVSGRKWKSLTRPRGSVGLPDSLKMSYKKRLTLRERDLSLKRLTNEIKEKQKASIEERKKRTKERIQRKLENEKRAEVIQKVSAAKVRRMERKKLRGIKLVNDSSHLTPKPGKDFQG